MFGWQDKQANFLSCEDPHPTDVSYMASEQDIRVMTQNLLSEHFNW